MTMMIPDDVEEFGTDGERVFFNFLRTVAKPDSRCINSGDTILNSCHSLKIMVGQTKSPHSYRQRRDYGDRGTSPAPGFLNERRGLQGQEVV